jgi:hypothetical protein
VTSATASKKRKSAPNHSPLFSDRDNETLLLATFKMIGIARIEVEYSGSGDSGQVDHVALMREDGSLASYNENMLVTVGEAVTKAASTTTRADTASSSST